MKDIKGKTIKQNDKVRISKIKVIELCLPGEEGIVVDCKPNSDQLVSVKFSLWDEPIDFHSKSLTVI